MRPALCAFLLLAPCAMRVLADTHYVDIASTNATPPYTNWATAATVIQDAIDVAASNDIVLVANGVYGTGGRAVYSNMTNRVAINKAIIVQSQNGPELTVIKGKGPVGDGAVRCAYVTNEAMLVGFTLTNGATRSSGDSRKERSGGGVLCETAGVVSNCVIVSNCVSAFGGGSYKGSLYNCTLSGNLASNGGGGGSYGGSLYNCTLSGNTASYGGGSGESRLYNCILSRNSASNGDGGGSYGGSLKNCTLNGNSASDSGGGSYYGSLYNCIVCFNTAVDGNNYSGSTVSYSCTQPLPSGTGNITNDPQLLNLWRIASSSPCRGKGGAYSTGTDMDGEAWLNPPSMGCDEYVDGGLTGALSVAIQADYTNVAVGCNVGFRGTINGKASWCEWMYGDGVVESNAVWGSHAWAATGKYSVVLTAFNESWPGGVSATVGVSVVAMSNYYVNVGNLTPAYPYASWATAATGIQVAVDAAIPGGMVWVTNGVYQAGGRAVYGAMINRVALDKPVVVRSVNGPALTVIKGKGPIGNGAVRCAYVTNGAVLAGFTLTNGATLSSGDTYKEQCGGGIWCESGGVVSNCLILTNSASWYGGGSYQGILYNCTLSRNSSANYGGGSYDSSLYNCTLSGNSANLNHGGGSCYGSLYNCTLSSNSASLGSAGGSYYGSLYNCILSGNSAYQSGGGSEYSSLYNCILSGNSAGYGGGGSRNGSLYNCTLSGNSASHGGGSYYDNLYNCTLSGNSASFDGGGSTFSTLYNCIVYFNTAPNGDNYNGDHLSYSCTTPLPAGIGNITNDPQLVNGWRIASSSPCRGKGNVAYATGTDMDGEGWFNPPSMGCDEYIAGGLTGALSVAIQADYTNVAAGYPAPFEGLISGRASRNEWIFGDGASVSNATWVTHGWSASGVYPVVLAVFNESWPGGVSATVMVSVVSMPKYYVNVSNSTPVPPYMSWQTAATGIQTAVDAAALGGVVWVTNGVYATGGRAVYGAMTNRVALDKPVVVRSVNGPDVTVIKGGVAIAVRCAYVCNGATLAGFTLTNGTTLSSGDLYEERSGGGVSCQGEGVVSNCVIAGNYSSWCGGGSYYGNLYNCVIVGNSVYACGGGSAAGNLHNCILIGNIASGGGGGGSDGGSLYNCALIGNTASAGAGSGGGGSKEGSLYNCTLIGNTAFSGGGSYYSSLYNCIVYYNSAPTNNNYVGGSLSYSCATPLPSGTGNITNAPQFMNTNAANYRLKVTSACIDKGGNQDWMSTSTDLDGNPRIINGKVDIGAYEFHFDGNVKALLQGAYDVTNNAMTAALGTNVPLKSPYSADARTAAAIPSNAVDWALVQVRRAPTNASISARAVFLRSDGVLVDADGNTNVLLEVSPMTTNYLVISHRNHLSAMSVPIAFTNQVITYDFTTGPDKYYGGTNGCVMLEEGVWGLIAGDVDGDGAITETDRAIATAQTNRTGYLPGDVDLDGVVR